MIEQEFIKVAKQLQNTHEDEVVKVAGILNRLKNIFKQITNPYYRQAVSNIQLEGGALKAAAEKLNKHLVALTTALKEGDVYNYNRAKFALDNALNEFTSAKDAIKTKADKLIGITNAEDKQPGTIDELTKNMKPEPSADEFKKYEGRSLKEFSLFRGIDDLFIRDRHDDPKKTTVAMVLVREIAKALVIKDSSKNRTFYEGKLWPVKNKLFEEFTKATLSGTLVKVKPHGGKSSAPHWTILEVETDPFKVPDMDIIIKANVKLTDQRADILESSTIKLMGTDKITILDGSTESNFQEQIEQTLEKMKADSILQKQPEIPLDIEQALKHWEGRREQRNKAVAPGNDEVAESVQKAVEDTVEKSVTPSGYDAMNLLRKLPDKEINPAATDPTAEDEEGFNQKVIRELGKGVAGQEGVLSDVPSPAKNKRYSPPPNLRDLIKDDEAAKKPRREMKKTLPLSKKDKQKESISSVYLDIIKHADQIPHTVTELSQVELANVLRKGYQMAFGQDPTAEVLAGGWAQAIFEVGRPIRLPNNNIGNIRAEKGWIKSGRPYFVKDTREYTESGANYASKGAEWKAFSSPEEGAKFYWEFITKKFGRSMKWMAAGDPVSATIVMGIPKREAKLKDGEVKYWDAYYTAPIGGENGYSTRVGSIYDEFMKKIRPKMPELKSAPTAPPGPIPARKRLAIDYTKEEREQILGIKYSGEPLDQTSEPEPEADSFENEITDSNISSLVSELMSVASPLTQIVKQAILKKALPKSTSLIMLSANGATTIDKIEYARVASSVIGEYLDVDARVICKEDKVQVYCSGLGSEMVMTGAIQAVCDMVSDGMKAKVGTRIFATAIAGGYGTFDEVGLDTLIKNKRKFDLRRVAKW